MKAEKEFKAEDGSMYKIKMSIYTSSYDDINSWNISVYKKEKNRRLWYKLECDDREIFCMTYREREKHKIRYLLKQVKKEWIEELMDYMLLKIKNDFNFYEQEQKEENI